MATLATFFKRSDAVAITAERRDTIRAQSDPFMLRALPNDDIYFYAKRVDNSRVVRQADPAARGECWSAVGAAALLLVLGASIIAPQAGSVLAGYKVESLKHERQSLLDQKRDLEVQEASLLSPGRLNALAQARRLTTPSADQVIHLDTPAEGSFARNQILDQSGPAQGKPAAVSTR
jgi:hypothetical protein